MDHLPPRENGRRRPGARTALVSGLVAAAGLALGTVLYLLDELDILASAPRFRSGGADREAELAANTVAYLERQHDVWWDIALRDTLLPVAFVALIALFVLTGDRVRWRHPASLMVAFVLVGCVLNIVNDLMYLGQLGYWRHTGWQADPPGPVIAVGAASDAVERATTYLEAGSYAVLTLGLLCLGRSCRYEPALPHRLGRTAEVTAVATLLMTVGIASEADLLFQVSGALTGILLAPAVATWLGVHLSRQ